MPITIALANDGPGVTGEAVVEVQGSDPRLRFTQRVELPTRSQKVLTLYAQVPTRISAVNVRFEAGKETVLAPPVTLRDLRSGQGLVGVIVDDATAGAELTRAVVTAYGTTSFEAIIFAPDADHRKYLRPRLVRRADRRRRHDRALERRAAQAALADLGRARRSARCCGRAELRANRPKGWANCRRSARTIAVTVAISPAWRASATAPPDRAGGPRDRRSDWPGRHGWPTRTARRWSRAALGPRHRDLARVRSGDPAPSAVGAGATVLGTFRARYPAALDAAGAVRPRQRHLSRGQRTTGRAVLQDHQRLARPAGALACRQPGQSGWCCSSSSS